MEKHRWIESRLHSISELMKKDVKMLEVSHLSGSICMVSLISSKGG